MVSQAIYIRQLLCVYIYKFESQKKSRDEKLRKELRHLLLSFKIMLMSI